MRTIYIFLDMGKPIKILDIVKRTIKLSGLTIKDKNNETGDIEIKFTGLRPGEKLHEELVIGKEFSISKHPMIFKCSEKNIEYDKIMKIIDDLKLAIRNNSKKELLNILSKNVEGYNPKI